jgi:hypothetical protein
MRLPAELIESISDRIQPRYRQRTLLSLSVTCHYLNELVIPRLLYKDVRLTGEQHCITTLDRLREDAHEKGDKKDQPLGNYIRKLHICSTRLLDGENVLSKLRELVTRGVLPHLSCLSIVLLKGWQWDEEAGEELEMGELNDTFWDSLKIHCPHLRDLSLAGLQQIGRSADIVYSVCSRLEVSCLALAPFASLQ